MATTTAAARADDSDSDEDHSSSESESDSGLTDIVNEKPHDDRDDNDDDNNNNDDIDTGYDPTSFMEKLKSITWFDVAFGLWQRQEIICYILFLICFITMCVLGRTSADFNYTQTEALRFRLRTSMFHKDIDKDINNIDDIYTFMDTVLLPIVFNDRRANGSIIQNPNSRYYVNTYNARILGGIRIKQIRHKRKECEVAPHKFPVCFDEEGSVDESPFVGNGHWSAVPFQHYSADDLDDIFWTGKYDTYEGGGYVVDILVSQGRDNASLVLEEMRNGEWIDGGTKALFIDFTAFDPSSLLHTVARIAFEMPANGVFVQTEIKTWKLFRYVYDDGDALAVFHLFFLIFIVGFTIQMGAQMYSEGVISLFAGDTMTSYWSKTHWRKIEVINMILFYVLLGLFVRNDFYMRNLIDAKEIMEFHSYRSLQYSYLGEVYCQAWTGFFLILKAFKYLREYHRFKFWYAMFDASAPHLIVFFTILAIFFSSFAVPGFLFFSGDVSDFRTFWLSVGNMMRYTVSNMNYTNISIASRLWGSIFWFGWNITIILVLLNVFIGIITQAYNEAIDRIENEDEEDEENKSEKVINIIQKFGAASILQLDDNDDGEIDAKELASVYPITVEEARAFITHFDEDGNGTLDHDEFQKVIEDQMQRKDEERRKKEQEEIDKRRREREMKIQSARFGGKLAKKEDIEKMKEQMKEISELLEAALNTTVDGARAVKRVKGVPKKPKIRSRSSSRRRSRI